MLTIDTTLRRQAQRHGSREALIDDATGRVWTISELEGDSAVVAAALRAGGIGPGDRVGMLSVNHPSMVLTYLAVARIGAVLVPLNWRLTVPELIQIGDDAGIVGLVADRALGDAACDLADSAGVGDEQRWWIGDGELHHRGIDLEVALSEADRGPRPTGTPPETGPPSPDDLLYLMYTSGTTGRPKGAMHTHATTLEAAVGALEAMDYRPGDRYLNVLPLFHVASLAMVNICLRRRCTMVLGRAFDPTAVWQTIAERRVNAMMAVPVMLEALAETHDPRLDTSSLRVLSTGAAPVSDRILTRFQELGIDVVQAYGLTETGGAVSVLEADEAATHLGTAGKPILSLDLRIEGDDGSVLGADEAGEIVVRGPSVMTGYWQMPDATASALRDGWFHTGDVGVVDEAGFLTIKDRLTDMIISGGENVYPAEVESVLSEHPAVVDVAVIGVPSPEWGESPCAIVVPGPGFDAEELLEWSRARLAGFKLPRRIETVDELPRNASGKVLKHRLGEAVAS